MKHVHPSTHDYLPAAGYDAFLPFYDLITKLARVGKLHRELIADAGLADGLDVLEIGCGTGNLCVAAKRAVPGINLTGMDPDPRALERARKKSGGTSYDEAYAQDLPYASENFDRVLSSLMIHHLPQSALASVLAEVHRVTKPGGSLHIVDFAGSHARRGHGSVESEDFVQLLQEAGFTGVRELRRRRTLFGEVAFYRAAR